MSSHSPSHIVPRPALRADEDDSITHLCHQKGAVKSQLIAALGTDPKLFCQINLDDIARSLHAGSIILAIYSIFPFDLHRMDRLSLPVCRYTAHNAGI